MNKPEWRGKMRQRKLKWFGVFFLCLMLVFSFERTTFAQPKSQSAGSFYLEVSTSGRTLIAPTAIPYEEGQTIREALLASPYSFKGLDSGGYIAAIEGVTGNYMLFYDGGGYDLDIPASQITVLGFAEQEVYSEAMISLIRRADGSCAELCSGGGCLWTGTERILFSGCTDCSDTSECVESGHKRI